MSSEIVAVEGDTGVVRVEVQYHEPEEQASTGTCGSSV